MAVHTTPAKYWLNSKENAQNPYYGKPPSVKGPTPCDKDQDSHSCKEWRKANKAVAGERG